MFLPASDVNCLVRTKSSLRSPATHYVGNSCTWEDMAMDFIISLLAYHGQAVIMVVLEKFFEVAHFGTLPHNFFAYKATTLYE